MAGEFAGFSYYQEYQGLKPTVVIHAPERETVPRERNLKQEISYLREHWKEEGLPENYLDLPGVEYHLEVQMGFFTSERVRSMFLDERKKLLSDFTAEGLRAWVNEYPARRAVNVGLLRFENGQWMDTMHGAGFPLSETMSKKERQGVPYDVYLNKAQPFFKDAPDGSVMIVNSTQGESMDGFEPYKEGRISILEKVGRDTRIYTISNTFDFPTHKAIMDSLRKRAGMPDPGLTEKSTPIDYMRAFAQFNRATHPTSVLQVVEDMEQICMDLAGKDHRKAQYIYENRTFEDVKDYVQKFDSLWKYDEVTERYIQEFVNFLRFENDFNYQSVREALAVTILRLSSYVLEKERRLSDPKEDHIKTLTPGMWDTLPVSTDKLLYDPRFVGKGRMGASLKTVAAMSGCGGTQRKQGDPYAPASTQMIQDASFSTQFEAIFKSLFGDETSFDCPSCGQTTEGSVGNQCPKCKITLDEWKEKAAAMGKALCL